MYKRNQCNPVYKKVSGISKGKIIDKKLGSGGWIRTNDLRVANIKFKWLALLLSYEAHVFIPKTMSRRKYISISELLLVLFP